LLLLLLLCVVCARHVSSQQLICHHVKHSLFEYVLLAVALQALHHLQHRPQATRPGKEATAGQTLQPVLMTAILGRNLRHCITQQCK
jgi:hypothetical protein